MYVHFRLAPKPLVILRTSIVVPCPVDDASVHIFKLGNFGWKHKLCSKYLEISMTSEPVEIVEEGEKANIDPGHCLEMLLSAMVEIVS